MSTGIYVNFILKEIRQDKAVYLYSGVGPRVSNVNDEMLFSYDGEICIDFSKASDPTKCFVIKRACKYAGTAGWTEEGIDILALKAIFKIRKSYIENDEILNQGSWQS